MTFALLFFATLVAAVLAGKLPSLILAGYCVASVVACVAYALDKSAARRDAWRISERTLHLLGLAGGWPGALVAQRMLRHKSAKRSFQAVFWMTVVLNCAALSIYALPDMHEHVLSVLSVP
ncbi:DUF1294 domain-containing protein [Noviherbaspirillum sp.]|uniref:DUF1294 domain-containing protein n=1 Tax=Noviherbaspirillum sp. TaxID=1926288 RepID=UPI002B46A390|nr:DUF1294 domain-containing protein [Noviherbaspirillum sp.]